MAEVAPFYCLNIQNTVEQRCCLWGGGWTLE